MTTNEKLRVIVADDTITFRAILRDLINKFDNCECIATAPNGKIAVQRVKDEKPDLVILDVEMPELDGPAALKAIREFDNEVAVLMVSGFDMENAKKVISALEKGALDFITKPIAQNQQDAINELTGKLKPLINMLEVRKIIRTAKKNAPGNSPMAASTVSSVASKDERMPSSFLKRRLPERIDLVLIATSTGGPNALKVVIPCLRADIGCPVLIVQHMPPMFTKYLSESLDNLSQLKIREASDGVIPGPGEVFIAPGGRHMILRKSFENKLVKHELHIVDTPPVNSCRPSADVLFKSVSRIMEKNILTVVLTGMGNDGAEGVVELKKKGAYSIIQDEKTSVVWGMPNEVYKKGLADEVLPLEQIGPRISEIVLRGR